MPVWLQTGDRETLMNVPPEKYILVQEERLLIFVTTCFEKAGLESSHARLISRLLVNNDLRGVRSHGTHIAHNYCMDFVNGNLNPRPNVRTLRENGVSTVIDGDGTLGYLPMVRAAESAVLRAKESSVGFWRWCRILGTTARQAITPVSARRVDASVFQHSRGATSPKGIRLSVLQFPEAMSRI